MRTPARRKKGVATREIDGYSCQDTRRIASCVGLIRGWGGEGASMTSRMFFGGWLYPDAPSYGAAGEATFEKDEFVCAAKGTGVRQTTINPTKREVKAFQAGISLLRFNTLKQHISGTQAEF
jgi:hypothetical protein